MSGDDDVAVMLAAWRDDVRSGDPGERYGDRPSPYLRDAAMPPTPPMDGRHNSDADGTDADSTDGPDGDRADVVPIERGRRRLSPISRLVIGAAATVAVLGGLLVAAGSAGPDSPLWPITRLVYHDRADSRANVAAAERAIAQARQAVAEGRYAEAGDLLDRATGLVDRIRDPREANRLRAEVAEVRRLLDRAILESAGAQPSLPPGATAAPGASTGPQGGPAPAQTPGPGTTGGGGTGLPGVPTPSLPGLPLPSLPLPTPSLPLPSLPLPSLPLPTLPGGIG